MARPPELTKNGCTDFQADILQELEGAFLDGMNNVEACFLAGISKTLFYEVLDNNKELAERFSLLRENMKMVAKRNIKKTLTDDNPLTADKKTSVSQWYLERRDPDFKPKQETDHTGEIALKTIEDSLKKLAYGEEEIGGSTEDGGVSVSR